MRKAILGVLLSVVAVSVILVVSFLNSGCLTTYTITKQVTAGYRTLIIDAKDLEVWPGMRPRIYDNQGNKIYGPEGIDEYTLAKKGIIHYTDTLQEAVELANKGGEKPLIIKAIKRGDDRLKVNIIISDNDAQKIKRANNNDNFLDNLNVVVVL